ncbi:23S rRNA (adenine(2503)-C(2))-methyltransferase RlmN [Spiroplasma endosymbiont of Aspidapion aeneum]|uniref:23S rRNA (adenine(2503)-C(2))-methyltransferase RlmN n=1 Tax=Spiroplasma endosymbiont of Aspidapion aeneum TaxID=3066276 RepID=UPI00313C8DAF
MLNIFDFTNEMLKEYLIKNDFKPFAADQIFDWVYKKWELDFNNMLNLSKKLREHLSNNFEVQILSTLKSEVSIDKTIKNLNLLTDKKTIETVLMQQEYGRSICVTTQVGCKMSCTFCASGLIKTERNLTTGEIVSQVYAMNLDLRKKFAQNPIDENKSVSHIVIMGIGEPFDNFENVINFIKIVNDPKALDIGIRHITVSTCGIVPKIFEFANLNMQVNLAISLHAPNNYIRNKLMPINKVYPIEKLIEAINYYIDKTNRRVTIEYILIEGINDSIDNAIELSNIIKGINCYVNLIPYNMVLENSYKKSRNILEFYNTLKSKKINVVIRKEYGSDINAACGQLRAKQEGVLVDEI